MATAGCQGGAARAAGARGGWRRRAGELGAILLLCAGLRVYILAGTEVIARDGPLYIAYARKLSAGYASAVKASPVHPGYPAAILGAQRLLRALGRADDVRTWELAGQAVALAASLAATAGLWLFAGRAFHWRIAALAALLFGLTRHWAALGADVLTDSLALCFEVWCVALAMLAAGGLRARRKRALAPAAAAGLCAGAAYLVRPEAVLAIGVAAAVWATAALARRAPWKLTLAAGAISLATAGAAAAPYALPIGAFTRKKTVEHFTRAPAERPVLACVAAAGGVPQPSARRPRLDNVTGAFMEAMHTALFVLLCVWVGAWALGRLTEIRPLREAMVFPSLEGAAAFVAALALVVPVVAAFYASENVITHRYLMFPAMLAAGFAAAGLDVYLDCCRRFWNWRRLPPRVTRDILGGFTAVLAAALALHAARPLHAGAGNILEAAAYLRARARPGDRLLVVDGRIPHYTGLPSLRTSRSLLKQPQHLLRFVRRRGFTYVVTDSRTHLPAATSRPTSRGEAVLGRPVEFVSRLPGEGESAVQVIPVLRPPVGRGGG
jgi:hypothetical protein